MPIVARSSGRRVLARLVLTRLVLTRLALARLVLASLVGLLLLGACDSDSEDDGTPITTVTDLTLVSLDPGLLLPGSRIVLGGSSFLPSFAGPSKLRLKGTLNGSAVDISTEAEFIHYNRMEVSWPGAFAAGLPADGGSFEGEATVRVNSALDGMTHQSAPLPVSLELLPELPPRLDSLQNEVLFVNDPIVCHGEDFLLGGEEGSTIAVVEGCFTAEGSADCVPVGPTEVVTEPFALFDRSRVVFPFSPYVGGIMPGSFTGSVMLINRHSALAGGVELGTDSLATANSIIEPTVVSFAPATASLGQYVDVSGGGFVGVRPGESDSMLATTIIELSGTFTPTGEPAIPADLTLVPQFVSGQLVRYVVNEDDDLGQSIDLRQVAGSFTGTATPLVQFGQDTVVGTAKTVTLGIGHVKQVVWLRFLPTYVESMRHFGCRGLDTRIRDRVFEVARRDYGGVNMDFRATEPDDFALYSVVDIGGPDPNGMGLMGYDNTPGKDDGNIRLYDKIGGVNALTQLDGYPGYGGVFVESLFSFSTHPGALAQSVEGADPLFDQLFDPFRPDRDGKSVAASELNSLPELSDSESCPASDRPTQIACAARVLGSLIGTTVSHEIAHSLGLADPGGSAFHNTGDWPNALMDSGHARSFQERDELAGVGPGHFCQISYEYLRLILPTSEPDPLPVRQDCY